MIHVAVTNTHRVRGLSGVRVHEILGFADRVRWSQSPPRIRPEHAVLDLLKRAADEVALVEMVAAAVRLRYTTPKRLAATAEERMRVRFREQLMIVLADVEIGVQSVLEHAHLTRVERAHGLPVGVRQSRRSGSVVSYRDVRYPDQRVIVELDGWRVHSEPGQRDLDLQRDLEALAVDGDVTVRLGWRQVTRTPCRTAFLLAQMFQRRGWEGVPVRCSECPGAT